MGEGGATHRGETREDNHHGQVILGNQHPKYR